MNVNWPEAFLIVGCVFIVSAAICIYHWIDKR